MSSETATERKGHHGPDTFEGKSQVDPAARAAWFKEDVTSIPDDGRRLLEEYSGIPPDDVIPHVLKIQDRGFALWSYPCIGQICFLSYSLPRHFYYAPTLARFCSGGKFLDAGCCFGQELYFLIHRDKIPAVQLYAFDFESAFIDMGYELFCDKGKLGLMIVSGDLLADS